MVYGKILAIADEGAWYSLVVLGGIPPTDGMAKVTNSTMEQLLRMQTMTDNWVATLPLVAMMINATLQSQIEMMPYKVAYAIRMQIMVVHGYCYRSNDSTHH